jgi:hypothetical protein
MSAAITRNAPSKFLARLVGWLVPITSGLAVAQYPDTSWTSSASGNWRDPSWSSGMPQYLDAGITNDGSKVVVFDASTYQAYTNAPNFGIDLSGNSGTTNTVIFDFPDSGAIIEMPYGFTVGPNGILENRGATIEIGPVGSAAVSGSVVQSAGAFDCLANIPLSVSNFGTFDQVGGTNTIPWISCSSYGEYKLSGGMLTCTNRVELGAENEGGEFSQSGGTLIVPSIVMPGVYATANQGDGAFRLSGGTVEAGGIFIGDSASYGQSGGIINVSNLNLQGSSGAIADDPNPVYANYELSRGVLSSASESMDLGLFSQDGGTNIVTGSLSLSGGVYYGPSSLYGSQYNFNSGELIATNITVGGISSFHCEGGVNSGQICNPGVLSLAGALTLGNNSQRLGALTIAPGPYTFLPAISLGSHSVLNFAESSSQMWDTNATLNIVGWNAGSSHLLFGTNSLGLTTAQLAQIQFTNPIGLPSGNYSAVILSNGEVVPNVPFLFGSASRSGLILTWSGAFHLQTSTDPRGPYSTITNATSPYTNNLAGDWRFFRLNQ